MTTLKKTAVVLALVSAGVWTAIAYVIGLMFGFW
jgi:hypothetical protein